MPDFFRRTGILPGTAYVIASNAPAATMRQALILKVRYGELIQICDGVADDVQINAAYAALPASGGEVHLTVGTYDIAASVVPLSNTLLRGEGAGTVLRLMNALPNPGVDWGMLQAIGVVKSNIAVKDLTIDGNRAAQGAFSLHGFYFSSVTNCEVANVNFINVRVHALKPYASNLYGHYHSNYFANSGMAMYLDNNSDHTVFDGNRICGVDYMVLVDSCHDCVFSNNTFDATGATISGPAFEVSRGSSRLLIANNSFQGDNNTQDGIVINAQAADTDNCSIVGNYIQGCRRGILVEAGAGFQSLGHLIKGNFIFSCRQHGIEIQGSGNSTSQCSVLGNYVWGCSQQANATYDNIVIGTSNAVHWTQITGNYCFQGNGANKARYGINVLLGSYNVVSNNYIPNGGSTGNLNDAGTMTTVWKNLGTTMIQDKVFQKCKNTSGGQRVAGDTVVLKAVAAGDEFTTTTTQGDDNVAGMVAETINDNTYGLVQVYGKTTALKVNGTNPIAIGDKLAAFTTAVMAAKALAGDQAFARALEAYAVADDNGVIDAFINSPWLR